MRIVREQSDIIQQFQAAVLQGDFLNEANAVVDADRAQNHIAPKITEHDRQIQDGLDKSKQVLMGMGDGKELSGGNRGTGAVDAARERAQVENKEKANRFSDSMFLALLDSGDLDTYVAEGIFGDMSAAEVSDVVSMIEAETGNSFDEYASEILGDEKPVRNASENDVDYQRRVLIAIADEVLEDDLSIKQGYENDPVARFVQSNEVYTNTVARVGDIREARASGATIEAVSGQFAEVTDTTQEASITADMAQLSTPVQK